LKTFKLNTNISVPEVILAIVAPLPPYRVTWEINRILSINLSQSDDYIIFDNKSFRIFSEIFEDDTYIKLLENHGTETSISSKYKNIDYFLISNINDYTKRIKDFKFRLLKSELVQGVFEIQVDKNLLLVLKNL